MTGSEEMEPSSCKPVGVLAFGSLIWDPGCLKPRIQDSIKVQTPWPVEYARKSKTRGYAPTLVRFEDSRPVAAQILVLDTCCLDTARGLVACREGCSPCRIAICEELTDEHTELSAVFYTALGANIDPVAGAELARLAIDSCAKVQAKGQPCKNGIHYLRKNIEHGVVTALTCEYKQAILDACNVERLERCEAGTLREAEERCLSGECGSTD